MAVLLLVASPANAESTVFINVNVIPMTSEEVLSARTVIVTNGKITAIGDVENTPLPDNAVVIDGTDRFLIPGLSEMHGHVPAAASGRLERIAGISS
jgi:imidazolonepropionase-like amidohydrolase